MRAGRFIYSSRFAFWSVLAMLLMISSPVALTLFTVKVSAFRPMGDIVGVNPSPYGYSVSLLIFVVPILVIAFWLLLTEHLRVSKRAFWWTMAILFPLGAALDFFFAQFFFQFPNPRATMGISAPALGGPVPIEEYFFYLTGFLAVLLLYIWLDGYWLHAYSVPDEDECRISFRRLLGLHPDSLILGAVLIGAAIVYRKLAQPDTPGFPGYFMFLVLCSLLPSIALFRAVKAMINWRALSLTLFIIVLISLLWEATLAAPYGWWSYRDSAMVGVYIRAWDNLPIEAVFVWIAVTYMTVLVFEAIRCWQASGKRARHAFFGGGAKAVGIGVRS
ncbi:MAG TPA: lycopene cyclase domain-containing protein [Terracidiphilus sp.]|nr:lycopene cyclase domain-containing protein [Terracidiphilus sp.]